MPAIAGHNSRVRIWQHRNANNQGNDGVAGDSYVDMYATRWQLTYRTEALDATTFEAPRVPFVTPMMTYVAGITDIEFTIDALWDTCGVGGNPYGFPDLRPGTRPIIDLYIKKKTNDTTEPITPANATPGLEGTENPGEQVFRFVAVIADCTTDSEVRGLVKYTISGSADPEILDVDYNGEYYAGEYFSTGVWLPSFDTDTYGPAFSSQANFPDVGPTPANFISTDGQDNGEFDLKPNAFSGAIPANKKEQTLHPISGNNPNPPEKKDIPFNSPPPASL